ncbi:unnamed protein product, partial [Meganyctiphanes norvegica]
MDLYQSPTPNLTPNSMLIFFQYGSSEGAYEPGCDPSPTMPQLHDHAHHNHSQEQAPLTPSSSSSNSSSGAPFVSPSSDRCGPTNPYVSPGSDGGSTGVGSPAGTGGVGSGSGSDSTVEAFCAGCQGRIVDRFYLMAVEKKWHAGCLRCSICTIKLDAQNTCFARDGHIFCRDDYQRMFGIRRCARCMENIGSSELVMRAREFVYHVQCFNCVHCNIQLAKGDHFGMNGQHIFCKDHYQMSTSLEGGYMSPLGLHPGLMPPGGPLPPGMGPFGPPHPLLPPEALQGYPPPEHIAKIFNGVPHKGRPRKRKPKEEPMDTSMKWPNCSELGMSLADLPGGYDLDYGGLGNGCQPVRTKRIRTSFKHHQLRTMKSYFAINHNPDAKDLKQLSQKTGLSKRVLQVWFQNARAKWRRTIISKDPSKASSLGSGGEGGLACDASSEAGDYCASTPGGPVGPMSPDDELGPNTSQCSYQQMFM